MSFESLTIERIKRCYTEDIIINIFWKYFLGKVYRVDFEPIVYHDVPGKKQLFIKTKNANGVMKL